MAASASLHTHAWLLDGPIDSLPGMLSLEADRLRFLVLDAGTFPSSKLQKTFAKFGAIAPASDPEFPLPLFEIPRAEIRSCRFPWYYFSGGAVLDIGCIETRFSFLQPQNTMIRPQWIDDANRWIAGDTPLVGLSAGRAAGKQWRQLLSP